MVDSVSLEGISYSTHQLVAHFAADDLRFTTSYWYDSVDLKALDAEIGEGNMQRVLFHIAAFEINKICSLRPERIDWGPYTRFVDNAFADLWRTVFRNVWAQWRYENDDPDYFGPEFEASGTAPAEPITHGRGTSEGTPRILGFFGGGKDSLVATKLLESVGAEFDTLVYASSIYGTADAQFRIIERLLRHCHPGTVHRQWIYDDFLDSPVLDLGTVGSVRTLTAAETPSSIFASLPIVLAGRYSHICLAHERSADTGQVIWDRTGEDVNHQWGKSREAELLLSGYISDNLVSGFSYFSILKPIYDVVIFSMLREHNDAVADTHSCNISKPWCRRCPKCVYVWLNYLAYLPQDLVDSIFGERLFEVEENVAMLGQLAGLSEHMPFECIGQVDEVKLALELCRIKGMQGPGMQLYLDRVEKPDFGAVAAKYTKVDMSQANFPVALRSDLGERLQQSARTARQSIEQVLNGDGGQRGRGH